jgi:Zn-finger nucleic acid-binding protein
VKAKKRKERLNGNSPRTIEFEGDGNTPSVSLDSSDTEFDYGFNEDNPLEPEPIRDVEPSCFGLIHCPHCRKVYGTCGEIEYFLSKENTMLPASTAGNQQQQQQSNGGNRNPQGRKPNGLPYIKSENLSSDKAKAKILDVRVAEPAAEGSRNFSDIRVKIACKGATWLYGLRLNNPELAKLQAAFSLDENNWPGKEFYLYNEIDEFDGKIWMRAEPIISEKKSSKKRGGTDNEVSE